MIQFLPMFSFYIVRLAITLNCYGFNLTLELPNVPYRYDIDNYEEGTFHDFIFEDTTAILVHCGYNVVKPSIEVGLLREVKMEISGHQILRRSGVEKDGLHYWQEDIYLQHNLSIFIRNATPESFEKYKIVLDKVKLN